MGLTRPPAAATGRSARRGEQGHLGLVGSTAGRDQGSAIAPPAAGPAARRKGDLPAQHKGNQDHRRMPPAHTTKHSTAFGSLAAADRAPLERSHPKYGVSGHEQPDVRTIESAIEPRRRRAPARAIPPRSTTLLPSRPQRRRQRLPHHSGSLRAPLRAWWRAKRR